MDITLKTQRGIALLCLETKNKTVNTLGPQSFQALKKHVQAANDDPEIDGIVIYSERSSFCYGVDIEYIQKLATQPLEKQINTIQKMHDLMQLLAEGKPSACILNGQCLGGGFELALACQYRVGLIKSNLTIGLPEAKIGIIPGLGGTQRLPRLIGLDTALPLMLKGETINEDKALKLGAIDINCKTLSQAISHASSWIRQAESRKPINTNAFKNLQTFSAACALTKKQTQDCYPHIKTLLQAVYEGGLLALPAALKTETHYFIQVLNSQQSKRMIETLFIARNQLRRRARGHSENHPIKQLGVIGGGFMGAAIAAHAIIHQIPTMVIEQPEQLKACSERIKRNITSYPSMPVAKFKVTSDMRYLKKCDIVIEAVPEDLALKHDILTQAETHLSEGAVLASNTSSIPITDLASPLKNPKAFLGVHFFSPVGKMPLVEIIKGNLTSRTTMQIGESLAHLMQKVPISILDVPGFYTTNVAMAYANTALNLLYQGVPAYLIETAARRIGMPTPPLKLLDEIGIDIVWQITQAQAKYNKRKHQAAAHVLERLYRSQRFGRKSAAGFYDYDGRQKKLWYGLSEWENDEPNPHIEEIERLLYRAQCTTAKKLVDNGILDAKSANVGAVFGLGFCPWSGGPV